MSYSLNVTLDQFSHKKIFLTQNLNGSACVFNPGEDHLCSLFSEISSGHRLMKC